MPTIDYKIFTYLNALFDDFNIEISVPQKQCRLRQVGVSLGQATTLEFSRTNHRFFSRWLRLQLIKFSKL